MTALADKIATISSLPQAVQIMQIRLLLDCDAPAKPREKLNLESA
ncbi:MAG: hypothetical protein P8M32_00020 [Phycisphaerales bacterium]|nr:hypothetical protein [Phycisphaerales bacterium]